MVRLQVRESTVLGYLTDAVAAGHAYEWAGFEVPAAVLEKVRGGDDGDVDLATVKLVRAHLARTAG